MTSWLNHTYHRVPVNRKGARSIGIMVNGKILNPPLSLVVVHVTS
jgi:hypothetical protein